MLRDLAVFNLIRYTIAFFAIAILILSFFTFFELIYKERTIIWVMIVLPFILILMVLGKFWLSKLKRWHIILILVSYWGTIIFLMFYQSGFETHRTYVIKHSEASGIRDEIYEVFRPHLKNTDSNSTADLFYSSSNETRFIRRGLYYQKIDYSDTLDIIQNYKEVAYPEAEIVINDYDDKRMYEFSHLKPGDVIPIRINWNHRTLDFKYSGTFFTARKQCLFHIPIEISNTNIHVDPQKDPDLTIKRLTFWAEKFRKDELELVRKKMMVRHDLRYKPNQKNEFFKYLHYDREGELFLPISNLEIDSVPRDSCSNAYFMLAIILKHNQNPYLVRLIFPTLVDNMKSWYFTDEIVFVGFRRMLLDFPRDFKRLF